MRRAVAPMFLVGIGLYIAYHTVECERGLLAWLHTSQQLERLSQDLADARARRDRLERRAALLGTASLDPDLLEEQARLVLNYGLAEDRVLIVPAED